MRLTPFNFLLRMFAVTVGICLFIDLVTGKTYVGNYMQIFAIIFATLAICEVIGGKK